MEVFFAFCCGGVDFAGSAALLFLLARYESFFLKVVEHGVEGAVP